MCFLRHDWSKWEDYKVDVKESLIWQNDEDKEWSTQVRQRRKCEKCGQSQDRRVR